MNENLKHIDKHMLIDKRKIRTNSIYNVLEIQRKLFNASTKKTNKKKKYKINIIIIKKIENKKCLWQKNVGLKIEGVNKVLSVHRVVQRIAKNWRR